MGVGFFFNVPWLCISFCQLLPSVTGGDSSLLLLYSVRSSRESRCNLAVMVRGTQVKNVKTLNKVLIPFSVYNAWAELLNPFLPSCPEKKTLH